MVRTTDPGVDIDADALAIGTAWRDLRRLRGLRTIGHDVVDDGGPALETGELDTLAVIGAHGPCRMQELAEALRVEPSTATRAIDRLQRRGLAERRRAQGDGRCVEVGLTELGQRAHAELAQRRRELLRGVLAHFTGAERAQLAELLPRFAEAVGDELRASRR